MDDDLYIGPTLLAPGVRPTGDHLARKLLIPLSVLFFLLVMVFYVFFTTSRVSGDSMEPTLVDGDRLLVTKSYAHPRRRDVVIFEIAGAHGGEREGLIKRVVGIPGDTVEIRQGMALVNGRLEPLESVWASSWDRTYHDPITVPEGHVYVLGDHRLVALDSRDLGPIPLGAVRGRVVYIFTPVTRVGAVR